MLLLNGRPSQLWMQLNDWDNTNPNIYFPGDKVSQRRDNSFSDLFEDMFHWQFFIGFLNSYVIEIW